MSELEPLYTMQDVMKLLGLSQTMAYALKKKEGWPHVLFGSQIRFTQEQIIEIVKSHTKTPQQPTQRAPRIGTRAKKGKS